MKVIQLIQSLGLASIAALLTALIAAITFLWNLVQFLWTRARESRERQFETYHNLVKELVQGDSPDPNVSAYVDRQAAVVFELRHFPRYYGYTERMLTGLQEIWTKQRILDEADLTLKYIRRTWKYRLGKFREGHEVTTKSPPTSS